MANGIYPPPSPFPPPVPLRVSVRPFPSQIHSVLSNGALLFMLGGLYAIYSNKTRMGKPHWTSWHAWAGILTLSLWAANVLIAETNTVDISGKRLRFLWQSRNHRYDTMLVRRVKVRHCCW